MVDALSFLDRSLHYSSGNQGLVYRIPRSCSASITKQGTNNRVKKHVETKHSNRISHLHKTCDGCRESSQSTSKHFLIHAKRQSVFPFNIFRIFEKGKIEYQKRAKHFKGGRQKDFAKQKNWERRKRNFYWFFVSFRGSCTILFVNGFLKRWLWW